MSNPATITDTDLIEAVHPGEISMADVVPGFGVTQSRLAAAIEVPPGRINESLHGNRGTTAGLAVRLARHYGTTAEV